jgi:hypothetical protein
VVATLDSTGARRETIRYSTYGLPFGIASGDVDGSGSVVAGDATAVNAQIGKSYGVSGYTVLLDVDLDGDVDVNDYNIANGQSGLTWATACCPKHRPPPMAATASGTPGMPGRQ